MRLCIQHPLSSPLAAKTVYLQRVKNRPRALSRILRRGDLFQKQKGRAKTPRGIVAYIFHPFTHLKYTMSGVKGVYEDAFMEFFAGKKRTSKKQDYNRAIEGSFCCSTGGGGADAH